LLNKDYKHVFATIAIKFQITHISTIDDVKPEAHSLVLIRRDKIVD
jgi:hypothetical protein